MKPHRVRMAHNLIVTYGLYKSMEVFRPQLCKQADMTRFHSDDYVNFLRLVTASTGERERGYPTPPSLIGEQPRA